MTNSLNRLRNWKTFAIVLGAIAVASILTMSSALAQITTTPNTTNTPPQIQGSVNLPDFIKSNIKEKFSDAANVAASAVSNGNVISGKLGIVQGSLVYQFTVIDDKNTVYQVIVDAGNGKMLYTSQGHQMGVGSMLGLGGMEGMHGHGMHGYGMHKFHNGGYNSQAPSQNSTSSTIPSSYE